MTDECRRHGMVVAHWISSGLFLAAYIAHLIPRKAAEAPKRPAD
jgi:hypothetical protein